MKRSKFLAVLLAVIMILSSFSCLSVVSFATVHQGGQYDDEGNLSNLEWEYDDETKILTVKSDITDFSFKAFRDEIKEVRFLDGVETIPDSLFDGYQSLDTVAISNSVHSIGSYAFQNNNNMTTLYLPRIEEIGDYAFYNCDSLKTVEVAGGFELGAVGKNIFKDCDALEKVTFGNGTIEIGEGMFDDCTALAEVNLPDSVKKIGRLAFENCSSLTEIYVPDSVEEIGEYAFYDCISAKTAYIGHNVNIIGEYVFGRCAALESVEIKCAMPIISEGMFYGCSALTGLPSLPDGVKVIGKNAFKDCTSFAEFVVPSTVTEIGDSAFDATVIKTINIPVGVEIIGEGVFTNCAELTAINVAPKNRKFASVDGILYDAEIKNLICCPAGKTGTVVVHDNAVAIGGDAFIGCTGIDVVEIPDSVAEIAPNAFNGCSETLVIKANCDSYAAQHAKLYGIDTDIVHASISDWIVTVDPTCDNPGVKEKQCMACGNVEETAVVDALGHSYDNGVVTLEPTCEAEGVVTFTCQNSGCDDTYTTAIPAIGHNYDNGTVVLEPTCEADGIKRFRCQNSGCYDYYDIALPATGHNLDNGTVKTEATCEADGEKVYKCLDAECNYSYSEVIPAIGHKYDKGVVTLEPTCEADGVKTFTCQNADCENNYTEAIPAIGHNYDSGVITKYPTVNAEGEITFTCQNDAEHKYIVYIPNAMFDGIIATNEDAYADENGFQNLTWLITDTYDIYIYANDTAEEWAGYRDDIVSATIMGDATIVENSSFAYAKSLKEVNILFSLGTIEAYAFQYCPKLETVITGSVKTVEDYAFYECDALKSVDIYGGLDNVGKNIFKNCDKLETVVIKNGSLNVGYGMFEDCVSLKDIQLPDSLVSIGELAFDNCVSLQTIYVPDSVEEVGRYAFHNCSSAVTAYIGHNAENIGEYAFYGCSALTDVEIACAMRLFSEGMFMDCASLSTMVIEEGVEEIRRNAFKGCSAIEGITLPVSLKKIGDSAFDGTSLKEIFIPADVVAIEKGVFTNCDVLEAINVDTKNDNYFSFDGVLYDMALDTLLLCPAGKKGEVTVWDNTTKIADDAFIGCVNVTKVIIPASIKEIADNAFNGCSDALVIACDCDSYAAEFASSRGFATEITHTGSQVWNITAEATCTTDGSKELECSSCGYVYEKVTILALGHKFDKGVVTLEPTCEDDGEKLFSCQNGCGDTYTEVVPAIGHDYDSVITLEPTCEEDGVKTFTCKNGCGDTYTEVIPGIGHDYDEGVVTKEPDCVNDGVKTFTCKNDCGTTYTESVPAIGHSYDAGVITKAPTLNEDGEKTFTCQNAGCGHTYVEAIPNVAFDDILAINDGAYADKDGKIQNVTWYLAKSGELYVYADGTEAEWEDYKASIKKANIAKTVSTIGKNAFMNCTSLEEVSLAEGVKVLEKNAFKGCSALKEIKLPETLNTIGDSAFDGTSLKEIFIPADVDVIEKGVFTNCDELEAINVDNKNDNYFSVDGVLYDMSLGSLLLCPAGKKGEVTVWDGTANIAEDAFIGCVNVTKVNIPTSVTEIADNAFNGCAEALVIACDCDSYAAEFATGRGLATELTHVGSQVWQITKEATCLEDGSKELVCSGCEYSYEKVTILALGHNYDNGVVTTKATCETDGVLTYTCTRTGCSDTYTEVIPAIGHDYDSVITLEPTCEADGVKTFTCKNADCEASYTEVIPALTHNYIETVVREGNCITQGLVEYECEHCGDAYSVREYGEHQLYSSTVKVEPTCDKEGKEGQMCALCHEFVGEVTILPATSHTEGKWVVDKKATCTAAGSKHKECTECGEVLATETIKALGHTEGDWEVDKKATTTTAGKKHKECTVCGETLETAKIAQLKCSRSQVEKVVNGSKGVKVYWSKVSGADCYRVYRKTKNSEWEYLDSTKKTSFVDDTAESGTKYYYSVRVKNEAGLSDRSNALSRYYIEDPLLKSVKTTKSGVSVKWTEVKGAEGYIVYRKTDSGSYKKIKVVSDESKVSYTDKSARKGAKCYYKVKAFYSKTTSDYSRVRSVTVKY